MSAESGPNGNGHNGRLPTGQFRPGHGLGGRPKGGSKQVGRLRRALEDAADPDVVARIMKLLGEIALTNPDVKVAMHAGELYLDRAVGRPKQMLEVENDAVAERLDALRDQLADVNPADVRAGVLAFLRGDTQQTPPGPSWSD